MQFDENLPEYLDIFIRESCEKHNMQYPRIGFIDDGSPNAFFCVKKYNKNFLLVRDNKIILVIK